MLSYGREICLNMRHGNSEIHMVVHIFSGSAECIAQLNPSVVLTAYNMPFNLPTNECRSKYVLSILKVVSFESLVGNDFSERGTQAEAHCERSLNRQL